MATTATRIQDLQNLLKRYYTDNRIMAEVAQQNPLFQLLMKRQVKVAGRTYEQPMKYSGPANVAATVAGTQGASTNKTNSERITVSLETQVPETHNHLDIAGRTLAAATGEDRAGWINARADEITYMIKEHSKLIHAWMYGDGNAYLGRINGTPTATATLDHASEVLKFRKDMNCFASPNTDGSSPRDSGNLHTVSGRNHITKTVTFSDDVGADGWADNDYIFLNNVTSVLTGLAGWLESTTTIFGADRSVDPGLQGVAVTDTSLGVKGVIEELLMLMNELVSDPVDALFINPRAGRLLAEQLETKIEPGVRSQDGKFRFGANGFQAIGLGGTGMVPVVLDPICPVNRVYAVRANTWDLISLGPAPIHIVRDDGLQWLRSSNSDDFEVRSRSFLQLVCRFPGANGYGVLPTV